MEEETEIEQSIPKEETAQPEKPLEKMTAKELREIAMEIPDVEGVHAMKKEELLSIIKAHRGIEDEGLEKKARKKTPKTKASPREIKQKLEQLREEKVAARAAEDKRKVEILRRRINRLKKETRKAALA